MSMLERCAAAFVTGHDAEVLIVDGGSMSPFLREGARVSVGPVDTAGLRPGRCYAYVNGSRLVLHRFVRMRNGRALLIGDNMLCAEEIEPDKIVAELRGMVYPIRTVIAAAVNALFLTVFSSSRVMRGIRRRVVKALYF